MTPDPIDAIIERLARASRVLLTTHVRPDGDALGSTAALQLALRARGVASRVMLLSPLPEKYAFLYREPGIDHFVVEPPATGTTPAAAAPAMAALSGAALAGFDLLVVVDTGTWSQLPGLEAALAARPLPTLVIDHHRTREPWGEVRWQDTAAAAACEMVGRLVRRWGVPLTRELATCLFTGIATDTGWLQYSSTTPATLRASAELWEAGVDADALQQRLYQSERPQRLLLQQRVMGSLRFDAGGRVASMIVRREDFAATGADKTDTEALVNVPLQVASVAASVLLTQDVPGEPVRLSFRGKGGVDLARFCEPYGGGGHARAAGARIAGEVDAVRDAVVAKLTAAL